MLRAWHDLLDWFKGILLIAGSAVCGMSSSRHSNSSLDCPTYCGFRTLHEVTPLVVSADHIAPFSLPQEALSYEPPPDKLIATFKNGDKERKIYSNTELANEELELLKELQEAAAQSEVAFYPSLIILATRYLSRTRGDPKKALKLMEETQKWREEYFCEGPITDTTLQDDFRHGIIYFVGLSLFSGLKIATPPTNVGWRHFKC